MFKLSKILRKIGVALAVSAAAITSAHAAVTTQLGFLIDASGSIGTTNFNTMRSGYAAALGALPTDGSVELSVYTFASGTVQVVAPTVISSTAIRDSVISLINGMGYTGGGTDTAAGINAITAAMVGSSSYSSGLASIINIATDGVPNSTSAAIVAATAAKAAGIDALTAEAIGSVNFNFLRDLVFSPLAGPCNDCGTILALGATPPNPMTSAPWVLPVNTFDDFPTAINAKVQAIVNPTPEPGTLALLGIAAAALAAGKRRAARRDRV